MPVILPQNRLTASHLADLYASGLNDATITACGFYSVRDQARVQNMLSWHGSNGDLGTCLAIPFFDAERKWTGYVRLKPDRPRNGKDGKLIKYESPMGLPNRAYFPPGTPTRLNDSSAALLITEGEKKAAKADQEGFACIGLVGVYGWQKKRDRDKDGKPQGEREFIDDLKSIDWQRRPVFLCFDSDVTTNPNVHWAEWHLAEALARQGAIVKIVRLPPGDPGRDGATAKVGLDDFLVKHGPHALRELLAAAVDPTPPETIAWEGPPVELVAVPQPVEFPIAVFPEALQRYISEGAKALNCPPDYFAVPMLAIAGGCIGNSRWLSVTNTHRQSSRLFACVVGGKGTAKSPALKLVREPLDKEQNERQDAWKREMAAWEEMPAENRGPPPTIERIVVGDATTESLSILLEENPRGLMLVRDELAGLLAAMNQYKQGGGHDRQWFLEVWGHTLSPRDRKSDKRPPVFLDRPFLGITGGTQPDVVKRFRGEPRRGAAPPDDGFVDRWLFSCPTELPAAGETWLEISPEATAAWGVCVRRLLDLKYQAGDDGEREPESFANQLAEHMLGPPVFLGLSADGREAWQTFTDTHAAEVNSPDFPDHLKGQWAKLRGYCGCLALIVHLFHAEDDKADVDAEAVNRAAELVSYFKSHTRRVYAMMDADPRIKAAKRILAWIIREDRSEFKRWELHKDVASDAVFPTLDSLDRPLELLESHGYVRQQAQRHGGVGRPPAPSFIVNPLWERRENRVNRK